MIEIDASHGPVYFHKLDSGFNEVLCFNIQIECAHRFCFDMEQVKPDIKTV